MATSVAVLSFPVPSVATISTIRPALLPVTVPAGKGPMVPEKSWEPGVCTNEVVWVTRPAVAVAFTASTPVPRSVTVTVATVVVPVHERLDCSTSVFDESDASVISGGQESRSTGRNQLGGTTNNGGSSVGTCDGSVCVGVVVVVVLVVVDVLVVVEEVVVDVEG